MTLSGTVIVTADEEIEATVGRRTTISIGSNPTTGYRWGATFDETMFDLHDEEYQRRSRLVGGGGVQVFTFIPLRAGRTEIHLRYRRSWEGEAIEERTYVVNIVGSAPVDVDDLPEG